MDCKNEIRKQKLAHLGHMKKNVIVHKEISNRSVLALLIMFTWASRSDTFSNQEIELIHLFRLYRHPLTWALKSNV